MVSALASESSGPGSSHGRGHCINRCGEFNAEGNPAMD